MFTHLIMVVTMSHGISAVIFIVLTQITVPASLKTFFLATLLLSSGRGNERGEPDVENCSSQPLHRARIDFFVCCLHQRKNYLGQALQLGSVSIWAADAVLVLPSHSLLNDNRGYMLHYITLCEYILVLISILVSFWVYCTTNTVCTLQNISQSISWDHTGSAVCTKGRAGNKIK